MTTEGGGLQGEDCLSSSYEGTAQPSLYVNTEIMTRGIKVGVT
jgi:hypothetical protein